MLTKSYYNKQELPFKIKTLSEYYKYHKDVPRAFAKPLCSIVYFYFDLKRRMTYIQVTKMLTKGNKQNNNPKEDITQVGIGNKKRIDRIDESQETYNDYKNLSQNVVLVEEVQDLLDFEENIEIENLGKKKITKLFLNKSLRKMLSESLTSPIKNSQGNQQKDTSLKTLTKIDNLTKIKQSCEKNNVSLIEEEQQIFFKKRNYFVRSENKNSFSSIQKDSEQWRKDINEVKHTMQNEGDSQTLMDLNEILNNQMNLTRNSIKYKPILVEGIRIKKKKKDADVEKQLVVKKQINNQNKEEQKKGKKKCNIGWEEVCNFLVEKIDFNYENICRNVKTEDMAKTLLQNKQEFKNLGRRIIEDLYSKENKTKDKEQSKKTGESVKFKVDKSEHTNLLKSLKWKDKKCKINMSEKEQIRNSILPKKYRKRKKRTKSEYIGMSKENKRRMTYMPEDENFYDRDQLRNKSSEKKKAYKEKMYMTAGQNHLYFKKRKLKLSKKEITKLFSNNKNISIKKKIKKKKIMQGDSVKTKKNKQERKLNITKVMKGSRKKKKKVMKINPIEKSCGFLDMKNIHFRRTKTIDYESNKNKSKEILGQSMSRIKQGSKQIDRQMSKEIDNKPLINPNFSNSKQCLKISLNRKKSLKAFKEFQRKFKSGKIDDQMIKKFRKLSFQSLYKANQTKKTVVDSKNLLVTNKGLLDQRKKICFKKLPFELLGKLNLNVLSSISKLKISYKESSRTGTSENNMFLIKSKSFKGVY